jgi:diacylglycerol kinase
MKSKNFYQRLSSFKYALNGLKILIKEEHNARIHLFVMIVVVFAGYFFKISMYEWVVVLLSVGLVFAFEIINTAIENLADYLAPERHESIKKVKDLAAAAVLVSAFTAMIIGLLIFIPKILNLF